MDGRDFTSQRNDRPSRLETIDKRLFPSLNPQPEITERRGGIRFVRGCISYGMSSGMNTTDSDSTEIVVNEYTARRADKKEKIIGELSSFLESYKISDTIAHFL